MRSPKSTITLSETRKISNIYVNIENKFNVVVGTKFIFPKTGDGSHYIPN